MHLYSAEDAGAKLGISARRVRALAKSRKVGLHIGHVWVFTTGDLAAMRVRNPGRPWPKRQKSR